MARYYVKKDEKWNVFSSIVDDFLYSDFMSFEELKALVIGEVVVEKLKDLETLLTNRPKLNTMPFSEAMEIIKRKEEPRVDCRDCKQWEYSGWLGYGCRRQRYGKKGCKFEPKDEPQTETKTETKNSNLTFEKRTMRDCYNCKKYETEGECIECHYEPKDEPQTERSE